MSAKTLEAKNTCEVYCRQHDYEVHHYYCDNCHFADNMFLNDMAKQKQTISFCGLNVHCQNSLAKNAIDLQN